MSSRDLVSILRRDPRLERLYAQTRLLQHLQTALDNHLPQALAGHCRVAALEQDALTLHTDSPARAAKLRFLAADILKSIRDSNPGASIRTIHVKARPPETKVPTATPAARISPRTSRLLRDIAETIEDPELRASLLRLSEN